MNDITPPVLHRAALERVLARAAELQAASTSVPDTLSESELVALGAEVGLSAEALKQALLEERMRVALPDESGLLARAAGPANFAATRVVAGDARAVMARLSEAMDSTENLQVLRRFPDRVVWGPRGGFAGALRQLTNLNGRGFPLARADEVSATVVPADAGRSHVRIEAALHGRRAGAAKAAAWGLVSGVGIATIGVALSVIPPLAVAAGAVLAAWTAWVTRRNYRRDAHQAQLAIEQSLDRLEFGEARQKKLF